MLPRKGICALLLPSLVLTVGSFLSRSARADEESPSVALKPSEILVDDSEDDGLVLADATEASDQPESKPAESQPASQPAADVWPPGLIMKGFNAIDKCKNLNPLG